MKFQFSTAARIVFGPGTSSSLSSEALGMGTKACLVLGGTPSRFQSVVDQLKDSGLDPVLVSISSEPDTLFIRQTAEKIRESGCDVVIALGGGSVLDAGKALAALLTNTRDIYDYLEVVGKGQPLECRPAPLIALPTTSGTGAEVTANAVLLSPEHNVKVSMRSRNMIPDLAIVDPELTVSLPSAVTAATGMDALTQLQEAFVSNAANPLTDGLCREGMMRVARSLLKACEDGSDIAAREDLSIASLFSGIALANAKLGAVHGFAAPLGGEFHVAHGAVCAALLPHVMEANIRILRESDPENRALAAYEDTARILTGKPDATAEDGVEWVLSLCASLKIKRLREMGLSEDDFKILAAKAARASSMKGNPVSLSESELIEILRKAF